MISEDQLVAIGQALKDLMSMADEADAHALQKRAMPAPGSEAEGAGEPAGGPPLPQDLPPDDALMDDSAKDGIQEPDADDQDKLRMLAKKKMR